MEMKIKNSNFEAISSEEFHAIKRFAQAVSKFKTTYFVFNRQLNAVLKIADKISGKEKDDGMVSK